MTWQLAVYSELTELGLGNLPMGPAIEAADGLSTENILLRINLRGWLRRKACVGDLRGVRVSARITLELQAFRSRSRMSAPRAVSQRLRCTQHGALPRGDEAASKAASSLPGAKRPACRKAFRPHRHVGGAEGNSPRARTARASLGVSRGGERSDSPLAGSARGSAPRDFEGLQARKIQGGSQEGPVSQVPLRGAREAELMEKRRALSIAWKWRNGGRVWALCRGGNARRFPHKHVGNGL